MTEQVDTVRSLSSLRATAAMGLIGHGRRRFCRGVPRGLSRGGCPRVQPLLLHVDGRIGHGCASDELILVGSLGSSIAVSRCPIGHVSKTRIHSSLSRIVLCM